MKNQKTKEKREIYYVVKHSVMEFSLMKLELEDGKISADTVIHRDIPAIVYGKLFQKVKTQAVG